MAQQQGAGVRGPVRLRAGEVGGRCGKERPARIDPNCFMLVHKEGIEKAMLISSFIRDMGGKCFSKLKTEKLVVQKCHIKRRRVTAFI